MYGVMQGVGFEVPGIRGSKGLEFRPGGRVGGLEECSCSCGGWGCMIWGSRDRDVFVLWECGFACPGESTLTPTISYT